MSKYSPERKAAILKKLLPPQSQPVRKIAKEEGCTFLDASREFIFAGTDDNGNNYYIDPDDAIQ